MSRDIQAVKAALSRYDLDDNPATVQQKSRDFYWYSPVLKRQLDHVTADLVVSPKSEAEVVRVLAACHRHGEGEHAPGAEPGSGHNREAF